MTLITSIKRQHEKKTILLYSDDEKMGQIVKCLFNQMNKIDFRFYIIIQIQYKTTIIK